MEYLMIDGYNVINSWDMFKNSTLEDARIDLIRIISDYQGYKDTKTILVFDAHQVKGGIEKREKFGGLTVIYTREKETADHYIERFVYKNSKNYNICVVTSDYLEQRIILSAGAVRMTSKEFYSEIRKIRTSNPTKVKLKNTIYDSILDDETLAKLNELRHNKY